jgi:WD40 repeat protein
MYSVRVQRPVALLCILLFAASCGSRVTTSAPSEKPNPSQSSAPAPGPSAQVSSTSSAQPEGNITPTSAPSTVSVSPTPQTTAQSTELTGHTSSVTALSWSPDGALLASSCGSADSKDDTIRLWNANGTLARILTGHTQPVTSLAWSPDGRTLATSSLDETIRLWNNDGTLLHVLEGHAGHVFEVAWSPNGKILASGSIVTYTNPTVQIWDQTGQVVMTLTTSFSGGKFYRLAWSPDGKFLLGGATDYKLWRADGQLISWAGGDAYGGTPAWAAAWTPDSRLWAIGNESGEVKIYTNSGQPVVIVQDATSTNSLAWSPNGSTLAGAKTIWRADGTTLAKLRTQTLYVNSVAWSPDGNTLASGGSDAVVHLWSPVGEPVASLQGHTKTIEIVAWSPDGKILASAGDDGTIRLWMLK